MKIDVDAVAQVLPQRVTVGGAATFTLAGIAYDYLKPASAHPSETCHSWTYGQYPKVMAAHLLADGGTVHVYAQANRWNHSQILVSWDDDERHPHWAWIPAGNVHRVTDSEWDIDEYRKCSEYLRGIR